MILTAYVSVLGLSALTLMTTACGFKHYDEPKPKNGFNAKVIEILNPDTLLVELLPLKETYVDSDMITDEMDGKLYIISSLAGSIAIFHLKIASLSAFHQTSNLHSEW